MKKLLMLCSLGLVFANASWGQADASLFMSGGVLYTAEGSPIPDGSTLVIVSSPDAFFSGPTQGSFASGNDVVAYSFALNSGGAGPGTFSNTVLLDYDGTGISPGNYLALYWYPTLDYSQFGSGPSEGMSFGFYRTDAAPDDSTTGWFAPQRGADETLILLSQSQGGSVPDEALQADYTVIPEPATVGVLMGAAAGLLAFAAKSRRRKVEAFPLAS